MLNNKFTQFVHLCKYSPGEVTSPVFCFQLLKETFISTTTGSMRDLNALSLEHNPRQSRLFLFTRIFFVRFTFFGVLVEVVIHKILSCVYK